MPNELFDNIRIVNIVERESVLHLLPEDAAFNIYDIVSSSVCVQTTIMQAMRMKTSLDKVACWLSWLDAVGEVPEEQYKAEIKFLQDSSSEWIEVFVDYNLDAFIFRKFFSYGSWESFGASINRIIKPFHDLICYVSDTETIPEKFNKHFQLMFGGIFEKKSSLAQWC